MVSLRIVEWIFPEIKKERDLLLLQVHDLTQRLTNAETLAVQLHVQTQKYQAQAFAAQVPQTPKVVKAATSAEVRKMTEQAFFEEEQKEN